MTTLRTLGTPRPDGPDARDRPKLFISSRCCCCRSGRPSHARLLPGPGERSLEPAPGPRGRAPSEASAPPARPPPPPGQCLPGWGGWPWGAGRDPSSRGPRGSSSKGLSMGTPATPVAGPLWVAGGGSAPSLWTFLLTLVRFTVRGGSYQVFPLLLIKSLSNSIASARAIPTGAGLCINSAN